MKEIQRYLTGSREQRNEQSLSVKSFISYRDMFTSKAENRQEVRKRKSTGEKKCGGGLVEEMVRSPEEEKEGKNGPMRFKLG